MATIFNPFFTAVDGNGNVRANAKLYFYQTGTTTPQNTYADASLSAVNANPVVADSNGLFPAIYPGDPPTFMAYKAILKTSADVTVGTVDPIAGSPIAAPISASILRSYLAGLTLSRTSGNGSWGGRWRLCRLHQRIYPYSRGRIDQLRRGRRGRLGCQRSCQQHLVSCLRHRQD